MNKRKIVRKGAVLLFVIYIFLLFLLIVFKYPTGLVSSVIERWKAGEELVRLEPQIVPFKTIVLYVKNVQAIYDWFFKNLACNVIMFIPYGFLIPFFSKISKRKGIKIIISGCILSVGIEILQYITAWGQMDIDDVILNTLGIALGYELFLLMKYIYKKHSGLK